MAKNSGCFTTTAVAFGILLIVGIAGRNGNSPDPMQSSLAQKGDESAPTQTTTDPPPNTSDNIQYDPKKADAAAAFTTIDDNTRECMHNSNLLGLRQGVRSKETIVAMTVRFCGSALTPILKQNGESDTEVQAYLEAMAYDELNKELPEGQ